MIMCNAIVINIWHLRSKPYQFRMKGLLSLPTTTIKSMRRINMRFHLFMQMWPGPAYSHRRDHAAVVVIYAIIFHHFQSFINWITTIYWKKISEFTRLQHRCHNYNWRDNNIPSITRREMIRDFATVILGKLTGKTDAGRHYLRWWSVRHPQTFVMNSPIGKRESGFGLWRSGNKTWVWLFIHLKFFLQNHIGIKFHTDYRPY